jgi:hypothetical protein
MKIARALIVVAGTLGLLTYASREPCAEFRFLEPEHPRNLRRRALGRHFAKRNAAQRRGQRHLHRDGKGNITGQESYVFNGIPCTATISGTCSVNSDGSGTDSIRLNSGTAGCGDGFTQALAIADGGHTIVFNNNGPGQEVTETWRLRGSPF